MEVKPGYKQTEVGVIPEEWDVQPLGELGEALIGLTYKPSDVREHGTLVLRSSNIQNDALAFDDNVFVDADIPDRIKVRPGDVLVCVRNGSRNLIGKTALLDELAHEVVLAAHIDIAFGGFRDIGTGRHADDNLVGLTFENHAVLEGSGLTLVGIADDVLNVTGRAKSRLPFLPCRKPRPAATAKARLNDGIQNFLRRLLKDAIEQRDAIDVPENKVGAFLEDVELFLNG